MVVKFLIVIGKDFRLRILDIFFDRTINAIFFWKLSFRSTFLLSFNFPVILLFREADDSGILEEFQINFVNPLHMA